MKKIALFCLLSVLGFSSNAQFHHNVEFGGSNYLGLSLVTQYHVKLKPEGKVYLTPKVGIGQILFWENPMALQFGLAAGYSFNTKSSLELGSSASYLFQSPFYTAPPENQIGLSHTGDYLWFNSLDYIIKHKNVRYTIGAGVLAAAERTQSFEGQTRYEFAGDVIPMLKLGVGL